MAPTDYSCASSYENAESALRGALALNCIVNDATVGESKGTWADSVIDDLTVGGRMLINVARAELDNLRRECWTANALLGKYGEDAKTRAQVTAAPEVTS